MNIVNSNPAFNREAIFVFTKDRPSVLQNTLMSLQYVSCTIFIVDDSIKNINKKNVFEICNRFQNCTYLGSEEFNQFNKRYNIEANRFNFLLRQLGNKEWNLGYSRNFALLYSKSINLEKVLFIDDDIQVVSQHLIDSLFLATNQFKFVGAYISGLVDDSILGHIATDLNLVDEKILSGGFMIFNPNKIDQFFMNIYNEDWIWLFLQLKNSNFFQDGYVYQQLTNPFSNYKSKAASQEFGEIAVEGIMYLFKEGSYDSLLQLSFWKTIIDNRKQYLEQLLRKAKEQDKKLYIEIITWVKSNSINMNAEVFWTLYQNYYKNRLYFLELYASLGTSIIV